MSENSNTPKLPESGRGGSKETDARGSHRETAAASHESESVVRVHAPAGEPSTPTEPEWITRTETRQDVLDAVVDVDEWLALPVARRGGGCPNCGEPHYGAINCFAFLLIYRCHGNELTGAYPCGALFRGRHGDHHDWKMTAAAIFGAFIGYRRRYITGRKKVAA